MINIALDLKRLLIKKCIQLYRILTSTLIQGTEKTCDGGSSLGTYLSKAKEENAKVVYTKESGRGTFMSSSFGGSAKPAEILEMLTSPF